MKNNGPQPNDVTELKPTERFSNRVTDYQSRPSYPSALLDYLDERLGLKSLDVADIGAGTGIFTRLLAERGAEVFAVEPNKKMREAAEQELKAFANVRVQAGSAEATGLPDARVSLMTCAQAFHWFEIPKTRSEMKRILRPGGWAALLWNTHDESTELGRLYQFYNQKFGNETYSKVEGRRDRLPETIPEFFAGPFEKKIFRNSQTLDREGFLARYFSSSYAPASETPERVQATAALSQVFQQFAENDQITLSYLTELYLGQP